MKLGVALLFLAGLGTILWLMFRDPPPTHNTDVDNGDGGFGGS